MRRVQTISRKDRVGNDPESSETIRQTCEACRMIWSDLRGDTESQAETSWPPIGNESAVTKVNGPKVKSMLALVKSGYLLESLRILRYAERKPSRENASGAEDQQERPVEEISTGILRDCTPDSNLNRVGKDTVRTAWRHAEGGRNDHSTSR